MGIEHEHTHSHKADVGCRHGHGGLGHGHNHFPDLAANSSNEKRMALAAALTGLFMIVEVIGGIISGSLALLADAAHMLTDFAALSLAWFGFRMTRKPANWRNTFGFDRFAVLIAFVNGLSLFAIAAFIIWEAIKRLGQSTEVMGIPMLAIAITGMVINILVFYILSGADKDNLNVRGAALHVLGDLLGSAAAIVAALIIIYFGWMPADLIMSVLVAVIILRSAWYVVRESAHILLEGAPANLDRRDIKTNLETQFPQIKTVDHIHAWSISQERPMMTLEVIVNDDVCIQTSATDIKAYIKNKYHVDHVTIEVCSDSGNASNSSKRA